MGGVKRGELAQGGWAEGSAGLRELSGRLRRAARGSSSSEKRVARARLHFHQELRAPCPLTTR